LASLADLTPPGVRLDALLINESNEATLNGYAQKREQIIVFKESLEKSGMFGEIENPLSNLVKQTDINFYFNFKVVFQPSNR